MHQSSIERCVANRPPTSWPRLASLALLAALGAAAGGCISAVSLGVKLVGKTVDTVDVREREKKLLGAKPSAADEMLGERLDTLRDVNSDRAWVVYPVELDVMGKDRYVVEVANDKIVALTRAEKDSDPVRDIPRALLMEDKVKGKPPTECAAELDIGEPLLTVRSDATGLLSQIYDARHFKKLGSPDYCILRFDEQELCKDVEFLGIGASTEKEPFNT